MIYIVISVFIISSYATFINGLEIIKNNHSGLYNNYNKILMSGLVMSISATYLWIWG